MDSGRLPAVMNLEGMGSIQKVLVEAYVFHVRVETLQFFNFESWVLHRSRQSGCVLLGFGARLGEVGRHVDGGTESKMAR